MLSKLSSLLSAALLAQLVSFAALPVISRMITPEEFGLFFFYASIAGLVGGVATGKVEQLYFSLQTRELRGLMAVSFKGIALVAVVTFALVFCLYTLGILDSYSWYLLPIGILGTALFIPHYFCLLKLKKVSAVSRSRVLLAVLQSGFQILFCWYSASHISLLAGLFLAQLITSAYLYWEVKQCASIGGGEGKVSEDLPLLAYGMCSSSLQTLNTSFLPSYFIVFKYLDLSGVVAAIHRLFMVPVNLVASSVSHVLLSEFEDHPGKILKVLYFGFLGVLFLNLMLVGVADFLGTAVVWFLGEQWDKAQTMVVYFIPVYSLLFVTVLVNQLCIALKLQKLSMYLELGKFLSIMLAFAVVVNLFSGDVLLSFSLTLTCSLLISVIILTLAMKDEVGRKNEP